jgi:hypothetical protein
MIVQKLLLNAVIKILKSQFKLDRMMDYVFKDNVLDKQVKVLRDDLDKVKERMIYLEKENKK